MVMRPLGHRVRKQPEAGIVGGGGKGIHIVKFMLPKQGEAASALPTLIIAVLLIAGCGNTPVDRGMAQPLTFAILVPLAVHEAGGTPSSGQETTNQADQSQGDQSGGGEAIAQTQDIVQSPVGDEELISMGEQVYLANCGRCHQTGGQGSSTVPSLANSPVVQDDDPATTINVVVHGCDRMPAFGDTLPAQDIAAVVSYIRNAWGNNAGVVTTDQLRQIQLEGGNQAGDEQPGNAGAQASPASPACLASM
jgi:mono/diheme cytochrome c family protein